MQRQAGAMILSYRRATRVKTVQLLRQIGWTGPIYIVVSSDDDQLSEYQQLHENVYVFDRSAVKCDYYDNRPPSGVVAARNIAWDIAAELGWTHFVVLDDDYTTMRLYSKWAKKHRWLLTNTNHSLRRVPARWGDRLFNSMWDLLDEVPRVLCVSFSQGGDCECRVKRKVMQTFFLRTDRRFEFMGRVNEDVTAYYDLGLQGGVVLQMPALHVEQERTQAQPGGLTDDYLRDGTYVKSMYTALRWPAHCHVGYIHDVGRIHHQIVPHAYPLIVSDE